jgi:DNA polymerase-3 subunit epsilon
VGKANNIRYRVNSHFSNNSQGRQKQRFMQEVHRISYQLCGTELMACLLESAEIKKRWPKFNSSQKRWEDVYGIYSFEDQNGYLRLAIDKNRKRLNPVTTFHYLVDGHALIRKLIREHRLCPKLCFMQKDIGPCTGPEEMGCNGACEQKEAATVYNERVNQAIQSLKAKPSFAIIDQGLGADDRSCILVHEGNFYGMGYLPAGFDNFEISILQEQLTQYRENSFIRNMVLGYATRFPDKVRWLNP